MSNRFFPSYNGYKITSKYGNRVINGVPGFHYGIDLVAKLTNGDSAVDFITAHTAGVVADIGYNGVSGNYVWIDCGCGIRMFYCHMRNDSIVVNIGDKVKKGTILGYMGSTGNSTGAHLHFGIMVNGTYIDPEPYLDKDYIITNEEVYKMQTLKKGSTGNDVTIFESIMKKMGYYNGVIDTHFGDGCVAACNKFQTKYPECGTNGKPDSSFGPACWNKALSLLKG